MTVTVLRYHGEWDATSRENRALRFVEPYTKEMTSNLTLLYASTKYFSPSCAFHDTTNVTYRGAENITTWVRGLFSLFNNLNLYLWVVLQLVSLRNKAIHPNTLSLVNSTGNIGSEGMGNRFWRRERCFLQSLPVKRRTDLTDFNFLNSTSTGTRSLSKMRKWEGPGQGMNSYNELFIFWDFPGWRMAIEVLVVQIFSEADCLMIENEIPSYDWVFNFAECIFIHNITGMKS